MSNKSTEKALRAPGLRVTSQRALILDIIRQGGGHLDAEEVYLRAQKKQPRLSLSMVYRTLQKLKELGLVEELHYDEAHHHYEVKSRNEHHHLVCIGCGKVVEFDCPLSQKMKEDVSREKGFEITDVEVQMRGYCPKCREDKR